MYSLKNIIDEIELNLDNEIDAGKLAKLSGMSVYEFRRIFTFVAGISFSEYVRKRRLSKAALELYNGNGNVTELSAKYGYDSPSSFSRAFKEFHGFSPSEASHGRKDFNMFTPISTEIVISGGKNISYSVFHKEAFDISGFCGISGITDTECCENVWEGFYNSELSEAVCKNEKLYAVYINNGENVKCIIGAPGEKIGEKIGIPESDWVSFKLYSTDDAVVNSFYNDVISQWFTNSGYSRIDEIPNIEVFPSDMSEDGFEWEIHIAIAKDM